VKSKRTAGKSAAAEGLTNVGLLSVVIPVYNGAGTVGELVEELIGRLGSKKLQIVLVNDGSPDNSHEVCSRIAAKHPRIVTYVNLFRNFGEHNAVMAGLNQAQGDYVVTMDDDFQNPPSEVRTLVEEAVRNGRDIVYSYYEKKRDRWYRNLGSKFNNWVANFMLKKPKDLYLSSFRCLNRAVVQEIIKYKGPFPYVDGLALRCTTRIGRVKVVHSKSQRGSSGYTFRKLVRLWLNMFINFSIVPLRVSSLLGIVFSALGVVLSIYTVIDKLVHPEVAVGWPSLFIAIMIFSGAQLLILGLLGEYLGRLLLGYNRTPQFIVREIVRSGRTVREPADGGPAKTDR